MNKITFTLGQGGLGSVAAGTDYISGYLIYSNTVPSGFTASTPKLINSLSQAESYGILGDYSNETKATATIAVTATGSVGDISTINIIEPSVASGTSTVSISYTRQSSDTTTTLLASSIANTVNASGTGYAATSAGATVSLTARPGLGASLNSGTPLSVTNTGTIATSVGSQFSGGVASGTALWHYHLSEFFRLAPNATIYVAFYPTGDTTYANISDMVAKSNGEIKQLMVESTSTTTAQMLIDLDYIQAQCLNLQALQTPISVLYANNLYSTSDLSTLPNLRAKNDNYLSVIIGADGGGQGAWLSLTMAKAVPAIGSCLGTVANSAVEEDIAWTKYNISNGIECETIQFVNGNKWNSSKSSLYNQLDNYGYIYLGKYGNITGSYWNDSNTCITVASDYAYIERNRVIGKAQRGAYADLFPLLNGPVYFNNDGTINNITVATYEGAVMRNLEAMKANGEISNYSISVDTTSNVQSTGILNITVKIIGVGVARKIAVYLGYTKTI